MKTKLLALIFGSALLMMATSASGTALRSDVLGLRLGMSQKIVQQQLAKSGRLVERRKGTAGNLDAARRSRIRLPARRLRPRI